MTNYNERLDEIARDAYRGEIDWIHDQLDGTSFIGESLGVVEKNVVDTKQALTSLIKELVAEAKPSPDRYVNYNSDCLEGYNLAIKDFEQNLLKELKEL